MRRHSSQTLLIQINIKAAENNMYINPCKYIYYILNSNVEFEVFFMYNKAELCIDTLGTCVRYPGYLLGYPDIPILGTSGHLDTQVVNF